MWGLACALKDAPGAQPNDTSDTMTTNRQPPKLSLEYIAKNKLLLLCPGLLVYSLGAVWILLGALKMFHTPGTEPQPKEWVQQARIRWAL